MIKILDCTLRDGAHVNKGSFGKNNIKQLQERLDELENTRLKQLEDETKRLKKKEEKNERLKQLEEVTKK